MLAAADKKTLATLVAAKRPYTVAHVPSGFDAWLLGSAAAEAWQARQIPVLHIAQDDSHLALLQSAVRFFTPELEVILFPAWDCLPYDRTGPHADISARRMAALGRMLRPLKAPRLILTTVNAALQRLPARAGIKDGSLVLERGRQISMSEIADFLVASGYHRASQVMDHGDFAIRGGLLDLFPPGSELPLRLDFFGDEIEGLRAFDPATQRTLYSRERLTLRPASEIPFSDTARQRFRQHYVEAFGPNTDRDPLYESVTDGRPYPGMEHWLPLFHDRLETLFDMLPEALMTRDAQASEAARERLKAVADYYETRRAHYEARRQQRRKSSPPDTADSLAAPVYKPLPPERLYLTAQEWDKAQTAKYIHSLAPFDAPDTADTLDFAGICARNFAPERGETGVNVYDAVRTHAEAERKAGRRVVFACNTAGSAERMVTVLEDHGLAPVALAPDWASVQAANPRLIAVVELALETGFQSGDVLLLSEQDILGDRLARRSRKPRRAEDFLRDASTLAPGDLVVHASHGIGRFEGLEAVTVSGAAHDCVRLTYHGGDKLYVPVENIEILSRHGSDSETAQLDKLGGVAWQARKARMKERIREMAEGLIAIAAKRAMRKGQDIPVPAGLYDEFCARFPYAETEDQLRAIEDVVADLAKGQPMDRLICGDVGFGKTEVALRAAFLAAMAGYQVAVIAPTTLLARQHYQTFSERFAGLPVKLGHLSRLVSARDLRETKAAMADGTLDIAIGTHALLAKDVAFKRLGLLIVDEEQHFGVAHKEKLKALRADVHILTLTATPIPRTLQMAMTGIRDLSVIASPPVDRLAVRTFVLPFDPVIAREALLREHYRGGQSFFVVPRIADLGEAQAFLRDDVPEVKAITGHGQMPPTTLEEVMTAFYEGRYDVLLSTTIVESGIDIPRANTLIVHRAEQFGLAQLYQLRGRVGRSKTRAYAYLTTPPGRVLNEAANRRLEVLQTLDTLGAGFTIASHDMDIRGAGNLLGDEQSGHIREVGVELYQSMLEEAVAAARAGGEEAIEQDWSPQINLGATVMIPESYVPDLGQRLALYRRLADLETRESVDDFCAELGDRFGKLPPEVKQLAAVTIIKGHAKRAGIEKIDAGPKGLTLTFRDQSFANPAGLIAYISQSKRPAKVRPDHSLVISSRTEKIADRLRMTAGIVKQLAGIAAENSQAA